MDYERKYKELAGKIKKAYLYTQTDSTKAVLENLLPELKESKDEQIRKELIDFLIYGIWQSPVIDKVKQSQRYVVWLSWLEKQGNLMKALQTSNARIGELIEENYYLKEQLEKQSEQKSIWAEEDEDSNVNDETNAPTEYGKYVDECLNEATKHFFSDGEDTYSVADLFYAGVRCGKTWIEKQGEQKQDPCEHCKDKCLNCHDFPCIEKREFELSKTALEAIKEVKADNANKVVVEPKFKVGDWIVQDGLGTYKIVEVCESWYEVISYNDGIQYSIGFDKENDCHLWTIQDAKDGNVLFTSSTASHETFIFKNIDEKGNAKCYFAYDSEDGFREGKYHFIGSATNCKPATKEQRDLLFSKMKEAGYEWDAEKKELKKIEQKQIIDYSDNFPKDNWELIREFVDKFGRIPKDEDELDVIVRYVLKRQNPAWSEEDVAMLDSAIAFVEHSAFTTIGKGKGGVVAWLKSLKEKYTWKPSDAQMQALKEACHKHWEPDGLDPLYTLYEQLRKLREG